MIPLQTTNFKNQTATMWKPDPCAYSRLTKFSFSQRRGYNGTMNNESLLQTFYNVTFVCLIP